MAIFFKPSDEPKIYSAYLALPTPKPSLGDFKTFVFEHGGIETVKAMDPAVVVRDAHGAAEARDKRKRKTR
jgi:hypothetical protein